MAKDAICCLIKVFQLWELGSLNCRVHLFTQVTVIFKGNADSIFESGGKHFGVPCSVQFHLLSLFQIIIQPTTEGSFKHLEYLQSNLDSSQLDYFGYLLCCLLFAKSSMVLKILFRMEFSLRSALEKEEGQNLPYPPYRTKGKLG